MDMERDTSMDGDTSMDMDGDTSMDMDRDTSMDGWGGIWDLPLSMQNEHGRWWCGVGVPQWLLQRSDLPQSGKSWG
jgi:hypothetical protein